MTAGRNGIWSACLALVACAFIVSAARAQPGSAAAIPPDENKARIDQLEKEVQILKEMLRQSVPTQPTSQIPATPSQEIDPQILKDLIDQRIKESAAAAAAKTKADADKKWLDGYVVGDDRKLNVTFDDGGFRFRSNDDAFRLHMGGRMMSDQVWWTQSPNLRQSPNQPAGSPLSNITGVGPGIGDFQDAFFLRRARFVADGTVFQTIDFKVEFDFENYNNLLFDESFIGCRDLPFVDIVRIGQTHVPFGLEAYASSRWLSTMERSPLFDAFYQEFGPGIFTNTTFFDQRMTMQHMFHRIDNFNQFNGASFGDGKYAYSGRVSILPMYEDEGRCLLHLGLAYQFRKGSVPADFNGGTPTPNPNPNVTENTDLIRFRSRTGLRDAVGAQGDGTRVVDTGNIIANDVQSVNAELLWYWGPLSLQAEACLAHVDSAFYPASNLASSRGDLNYYGVYGQIGYILTGENRGYDKRMGKHERVKPFENFFLVRDENGQIQYGFGAWELVYRYGYLNLNDDQVQGGIYGEHTIGVNWYWTPNIKVQANYINGQRTVPAGAVSGNIQGFGLRASLEF